MEIPRPEGSGLGIPNGSRFEGAMRKLPVKIGTDYKSAPALTNNNLTSC